MSDFTKRGWYITVRNENNVAVTKYGKTLEDLQPDIGAAMSCYIRATQYGLRPFRYTLKYIGKLD